MEIKDHLCQLVVVQNQRLQGYNTQQEHVRSMTSPCKAVHVMEDKPILSRSEHRKIDALQALKLLSDSCLASVRRFCLKDSLWSPAFDGMSSPAGPTL